MMADSGARGSNQQIRQLAGMRGLMAKPSGEIIETPITGELPRGPHGSPVLHLDARRAQGPRRTPRSRPRTPVTSRAVSSTSRRTPWSRRSTAAPSDGIWIQSLEEGGEVVQPLGERILGRVVLEDVVDPVTGEVILKANDAIDESKVQAIEDAGIQGVIIRSVLTCEARRGVCANCYGRDLARGYMVNIGEAVGVIAAQSIGEPGTQLTMRTFHIGGAAARGKIEQSSIENRSEGIVRVGEHQAHDQARRHRRGHESSTV
jgi:DNA-directed RNA polymerase subunit beta'